MSGMEENAARYTPNPPPQSLRQPVSQSIHQSLSLPHSLTVHSHSLTHSQCHALMWSGECGYNVCNVFDDSECATVSE